MPVLLLIRHATNDFVKTGRLPGRTPNIHLNEEGRRQAKALAQLLRDQPLDAIYSSPLERAIETAWCIAADRSLPVHICPDLADVDNGDYTGMEIKRLSEDEATRDFWRTVVETPSQARFPNGEGLFDMQQRVVKALEALAAAHPDLEAPAQAERAGPSAEDKPRRRPQTIAIVAHADVIKAALAHYLGMPFDNFQRLSIAPASISAVALGHDDKTGRRYTVVHYVNRIPPAQ
jgi:probable phosphoglycerate mutase